MKCITLWQPWATLIMLGIKKIETRSWHTQHRGPLAIHSAAKDHPTLAAICATEPFRSQLENAGFSSFRDLPRRCIMGTVQLDDCVRVELLPPGTPTPLEEAFGDYSPGGWGWLLSNPTPWSSLSSSRASGACSTSTTTCSSNPRQSNHERHQVTHRRPQTAFRLRAEAAPAQLPDP